MARSPGIEPRTSTITVNGISVTVNQPGSAPLTVTSTAVAAPNNGDGGSVHVIAMQANIAWSAVTNASWITILNGPNFSGTATVSFRTTANPGATVRSGTMTVAGETVRVDQAGASLTGAMRFVPVTPCRVVDTRALTGESGPFGLPVMEAGTQRDFPIPQGRCNIPANATAYSLNATVVPRGPLSYLTLFPAGTARPLVSTLNSFDGRIKANAAIVPAGATGSITAFVTGRTDLILDINGYFLPPAPAVFAAPFFPVSPCRVADTRNTVGTNGGPFLAGGQTRAFVIAGACAGNVPRDAMAYSLNVTVVPRSGPLSYLTIWPVGETQPVVSTLNAPTGTVVANAAIVRAGSNGLINVFATNDTDVILDINGYFGFYSFELPLSFYPSSPCRVSDSREANGEFGGPVLQGAGTRSYAVPLSACGIPALARAYSLNATALPASTLSYLSVWPVGQSRPLVSTLNSFDGSVVANALLVPAGTNGAINAYVTDGAHLIFDINGFFAP